MRSLISFAGDRCAGTFGRKTRTFSTIVFVALGLVAANVAQAANPQPSITISDTSGMAPLAVHVHAMNSNLGAGTPITARYEWDFGDPAGEHNKLVGFNAAHLYERSGNYTIKLTITNEDGDRKTVTKTVNVSADTRREIYVAPDGNDSKNGNSPNNAVRTFSRAVNLSSTNSAILFKRDSTYDVPQSEAINHSNVLISTWGSGSRPKLRWVGSAGYSAILGTSGNARNVVVQDIVFASNRAANSTRDLVDGIRPGGENIAVDGCRFVDLSLAMNTNQQPEKVLVMNCDCAKIGAYFSWVQGTDHVYVGNTVEGSWFEHNIRMYGVERILIANNSLANNDKRTIWVAGGEYIYVSGNTTDTGRVSVGPDPTAGAAAPAKWVVLEGNRLTTEVGGNSPIECLPGGHNVMIRNNIISVKYLSAISVAGQQSNGMVPRDIFIYNNTAINPTEIGRFIAVSDGAQRVTMRNNLHSALNLLAGDSKTSNVYVSSDNLNSFTEIARNVWATPDRFNWVPDGYHYVWPTWSDARGYKNPAEWQSYSQVDKEEYAKTSLNASYAPSSSSVAARHARLVKGVHVDFYGNARPESGAWSAGAVELNSGSVPEPDPDPDPDNDPLVAFYDNFQADKGWTVSNQNLSDGAWERGSPAGNGNRGDPTFDYDLSGKCCLTGNRPGDSDVDGGPTILTSPLINLSYGTNPKLSFARWVYCDDGSDDRIITEASADNGATWTQVEVASSTGDWRYKTYSLNGIIPATSQVRIRFVIADAGNNSITEAAIDDLMIRFDSVHDVPPVPGDLNGDGVINANDIAALFAAFGPCQGCPADVNADGTVDVSDIVMFIATYL